MCDSRCWKCRRPQEKGGGFGRKRPKGERGGCREMETRMQDGVVGGDLERGGAGNQDRIAMQQRDGHAGRERSRRVVRERGEGERSGRVVGGLMGVSREFAVAELKKSTIGYRAADWRLALTAQEQRWRCGREARGGQRRLQPRLQPSSLLRCLLLSRCSTWTSSFQRKRCLPRNTRSTPLPGSKPPAPHS
ncbi:hypothetical protein K402DRAFT_194430 [Aulographum hederae CBS 113979]|uniref:Uncharacterized protein n=1 Tax=Aulographum hederae CBS 113979 TaxID=1176131 RepID=A0A6G1GNU0_9PEZI|nr:hypothetical protein K402DRAFT_194430 [Aulographum hederae CBS 113979]